MADINFGLLKQLCETPGIPGREEPIRRLVADAMRPLVGEVAVDALGNVIGRRPGRSSCRVMLAAHMDEIGFMVKHIDDKGFVRILPMGGWDPRNVVSQRVYVHTRSGESLLGAVMPGVKPIHMQKPEDANKPPTIDELFVDLGLPADEVKARLEIGDPVTMARTAEIVGGNVMSKTLDARVAVFVMLEALRVVGDHEAEVLAVATTQEEVGTRGALVAAHDLQPTVGVAIDTTLANDYPGPADYDAVTRLGSGVGIKILDSSLICNPQLVRHFRDLAEANNISHQMEILPRGGTDAGAIQRSRGPVPSITLSVPSRYVHTVNEMASLKDIEAAIQLLTVYLRHAHEGRYGFEADLG